MGWVNDLHGRIVALDTSPLIYYFEDHDPYAEVLEPFFQDLHAGKFQVVTSVVTLLEVLVRPLRLGDEKLASLYNDSLLSHPNIATIPVGFAIAQAAGEIRAQHNLKTPDALQVATAVSHHAEVILTNDRDLGGLSGLEVLRVRDLASG